MRQVSGIATMHAMMVRLLQLYLSNVDVMVKVVCLRSALDALVRLVCSMMMMGMRALIMILIVVV